MAGGQNIKFVKAGFLVKMDLQELRNHLHLKHKNLVEERKAKQRVSNWANPVRSSVDASAIDFFKPTKLSMKKVVAERQAVD